jgi:mono/diheme cytochrome c family protein
MKTKSLILILLIGLLTACTAQATEAPASQPTEASAPVISSPAGGEAPVNPPAPTEAPTTAPDAGQAANVSFANDILPILNSRCGNCHGGQKIEEGLVLKTYSDLMAGSDNGPVIVPGDAGNSLLVKLVANLEMPKKGPKLTPPQIQLITDWVNQGARNASR